ncbi:hypothetical protein [Pontibacter arcticus]|uniref:Uncharacterized protein n=1 Tax=Pontibacter arcticus TaxID=2080288 RepID=A0A364RI43_9BACT|nr:hypothetical protein [Pontibacter arcticus]RAU84020.1 hypothetical protein DP923_02880 [Pontibacter arcticus]
MKAFLYIQLSAGKDLPYQQPILSAVKEALPDVTVLDIDLDTDKLTLQMATRLLEEATQAVVCIKGEQEQAGFGSILPLFEALLTPHQNRLLLILGQPARLLRMLQARPQLLVKQVQSETEIVQQAAVFFGELD